MTGRAMLTRMDFIRKDQGLRIGLVIDLQQFELFYQKIVCLAQPGEGQDKAAKQLDVQPAQRARANAQSLDRGFASADRRACA